MGSSLFGGRGEGLVVGSREERGEGRGGIGWTYQEPGTDWMTILCSWTPEARSLAFAPARRGSMIWCGGRQCRGLDGSVGSGMSAYGHVPAGMDDSNAQGASIVLLCFAGAF